MFVNLINFLLNKTTNCYACGKWYKNHSFILPFNCFHFRNFNMIIFDNELFDVCLSVYMMCIMCMQK